MEAFAVELDGKQGRDSAVRSSRRKSHPTGNSRGPWHRLNEGELGRAVGTDSVLLKQHY